MTKRKTTADREAEPETEDHSSPADENDEDRSDESPARDASLAERILWVTERIGYLKKDTKVSGGGDYAAVTHDAVTAHIRHKLVRAGILVWPTCISVTDVDTGHATQSGRNIIQHRAEFLVQFENAFDKEDTRAMCVYAYADDWGDKAPGKASSYALKYALLKMFKIETGEDDESRVSEDDGGRKSVFNDSEKMIQEIWDVAEEAWGDDANLRLTDMAKRRFFVDNYGLIPQSRFDDAKRSIRVAADRERQGESK